LLVAGCWLLDFPLAAASPTDESLTTKVDTLRRLFRKLMTYNIPRKKSPEMNSGGGRGNQKKRGAGAR